LSGIVPKNTNDFSAIDPERKLTWFEAYKIKTSLSEFETVFAAELPTFDTYIVSKKGIYSTADLVERADMAFDEGARTHLSAEVLSDFRQAGRCLAFELATGAGFHTMRAVEAVVRSYWRLVLEPERIKPPEMAVCINELRAAKESERLMDILDHIRDLHRNTIMHPEVFLEMKDALRLFDVAKSAISAMADRIGELEEQAAIEEAIREAAEKEALEEEAAAKVALEEEASAKASFEEAPEETEAAKPATRQVAGSRSTYMEPALLGVSRADSSSAVLTQRLARALSTQLATCRRSSYHHTATAPSPRHGFPAGCPPPGKRIVCMPRAPHSNRLVLLTLECERFRYTTCHWHGV
jgi:hypothetical protein